MTPAARIAAAIDVLDEVLAGRPAEQVLTNWGRSHRFAGSGDRAAIRDHVFGALRCRRSLSWLGGAETGRGMMIGALRRDGVDPATMFTGDRFAPAPLTEGELAEQAIEDAPRAVRLDCPDWLLPEFDASLGSKADAVLQALRTRAPVFLRVNIRKTSVPEAIADLRSTGIEVAVHPLANTALEVTANPRRVQSSAAYADGRVELQDAASQSVTTSIPLRKGMKVLDFCAGGGGKTLALAAREEIAVTAHDIDRQRMRDLPARAARAGVDVTIAGDATELQPGGYDLVLCDAPCSGSGAWRRSPEAKWQLTRERLNDLVRLQSEILDTAHTLVAGGGVLAYVTCSLLHQENADQVDAFLARHPAWAKTDTRELTPLDGGDGFYLALLQRA